MDKARLKSISERILIFDFPVPCGEGFNEVLASMVCFERGFVTDQGVEKFHAMGLTFELLLGSLE